MEKYMGRKIKQFLFLVMIVFVNNNDHKNQDEHNNDVYNYHIIG